MYKDTGKKILGLANTICIIGIVISCLGGLIVMASDSDMFVIGLLAAGQNPPAAPAQNPYGYNATPYAAPYGQENGQS